jgi:FkbM family methyltransferase
MTLKRRIADFAERQFDLRIVKRWNVPLLFEQEHLSRFFKHFEIDCVFDVGANAGQYADMIRDKCGYSGPVISFEPIPALASQMKKRSASRKNWIVEQNVLDKQTGTVEFNIMADDQFSSLKKPRSDSTVATEAGVRIEASTLALEFDRFQKMIGFKRPFLKMDTQGSDLDVAIGAGDRLQQFIGLQSELSFYPLYENVPSALEMLDFYRSKGFTLSAFVPNNAGQFPKLYETDCILYRSDAESSPTA